VHHVQGEHGEHYGFAQEDHVTHQIDQDNVRKAMMKLEKFISELYRVWSMYNLFKESMDSSMGLLKRVI
jgi:hypothetical protein